MLQRADDAQLFAVAKRELFHLPARVKCKAFAKRGSLLRTVHTVQLCGKCNDFACTHAGVKSGFGGKIADLRKNLLPALYAVEPKELSPPRSGENKAEQRADGCAFACAVWPDETENSPSATEMLSASIPRAFP